MWSPTAAIAIPSEVDAKFGWSFAAPLTCSLVVPDPTDTLINDPIIHAQEMDTFIKDVHLRGQTTAYQLICQSCRNSGCVFQAAHCLLRRCCPHEAEGENTRAELPRWSAALLAGSGSGLPCNRKRLRTSIECERHGWVGIIMPWEVDCFNMTGEGHCVNLRSLCGENKVVISLPSDWGC